MTATRMRAPSWLGGNDAPKNENSLIKWGERLSPTEGWTTFGLVVGMLLIVGGSVTSAGWVETPGLRTMMIVAAIVGLILAKVRAPVVLLHVAGLLLGFVVVVLLTSSLGDGDSVREQVQELWRRLGDWYDAATSGGISRDLLPFTLILMTVGWLVAYTSSWFIFRSRNVWIPVVIAGVAVLTNLSFLPGRFTHWFFLFTFFAMLLVVRIGVLENHDRWRRLGVRFSVVSGWLTVSSAIWIAAAVLLVSAAVPEYEPVSKPLATLWNVGRSPLSDTENHFARLFSGVPSKKDQAGRFFGDSLPFQGAISFGGEVAFWASTDYPSYWVSQTYSEYTPEGWLAGKTQKLEAGPDVLPPARSDDLERVPVEQTIHLNFDTRNFLSGGGLDWVSRKADLRSLAPMSFEIEIAEPDKDVELPQDIQGLAVELRQSFQEGEEGFIESRVTRMLPDNLVLTEAHYFAPKDEERRLKAVTLVRKGPISPEIVSWRFTDEVPKEDAYFMTSAVSMATNADLNESGEDYGAFITDHYLQLPSTLSERIRDLAVDLTAEADTPLNKALAIQDYLRGPDFTYAQDIDKPPIEAGGVDHFLFETRTGYSDYFASSMAVMLRAAGVPSRMAAGYAPGEYDSDSGLRFIKDSDSHGWVQVYFPGYGWIDFEPTPEWPLHERGLLPEPSIELPMEGAAGSSGLDPLDLDDLWNLDQADDFARDDSFLGLPTVTDSRLNPFRYLVPLAITVVATAVVWFIGQALWMTSFARTPQLERPYAKMGRLGTLAGVRRRRHLTPIEYATTLAADSPKIAGAAFLIGRAFSGNRYGSREPSREEVEQLEGAWKSMRLILVGKALGRLVPSFTPHAR